MTVVPLHGDAPDAQLCQVAQLHERELQAGLLAKLGEDFLVRFYRFVADDPDCVLLAALEGDRVLGFVSGTRDIGRFYRRFLLRRGPLLARYLLPYLLRRRAFFGLGSFQRYLGRGPRGDLPVSELTSLAVAPGEHRRGVGRALFRAFQRYLHELGIRRFKVSAATTQRAALDFYPALGGLETARARLGELELVIFVCPSAP